MDFQILGTLEARDGGRSVAVGGTKQRALLALLLLNANQPVSTDRLIDDLWPDSGRDDATNALQVAVSRLRRILGEDLVTRAPGYELHVADGDLDAARFERGVAAGRAALGAGDLRTAATSLREALALWRGPALADLAFHDACRAEIARLEELRLSGTEDALHAELELGRDAELVAELEALVASHPLRERLRGQLMLALYRCGRQAEALSAFRSGRAALVDDLGIEPGRELTRLHAAILAQDASLDAPPQASVAAGSVGDATRGVFVGRRRELSELRAGLDGALAGRGCLCLLIGEPGIGKSRLADELLRDASARGARVLVGRCWEAGGAPAYWPWVQSLRAYVAERDGVSLRAELGAGAPELAQLLPELRELLGDVGEPPALDPDAARFRLFDAVASFLRAAAAARPIVLMLDDLHAADESSLLLLEFLARGLRDSQLLVIGALRDVDPTPRDTLTATLAQLTREPVTRRIALTGLSVPEVGAYIAHTAGAEPDPRTVAAVHARTEGNALFVDEVTRLLVADGRLEGIPQGVHDVIGLRMRRISGTARQGLSTASVLGREFAADALARMTGGDPLELLDEALQARVVGEVPGTPGRLRFSHALVRDTLYDELSPSRRRQLHAQAGSALAALYAADEDPHLAELAHHFVQAIPAGEPRRAVTYTWRAADRAKGLLAFEEAVRLYRTALETLEIAGELEGPDRCELLLALGDAEARGGDLGAAQKTFLDAADVAQTLGAPDALARAALGYGGRYVWFRAGRDRRLIPLLEDALAAQPEGDAGVKAMLLARLAGALRDRPVPERRSMLTREAVEIARRVGDPQTLAYAIEGTYSSISWPREVDRWLAMGLELCALAEPLGDKEKLFSGHLHAMGALTVRGDMDGADERFAAALAVVADELRQPAQVWAVTMAGVMRALHAGRFEEAEDLFEREVSLDPGARGMDETTFEYVRQIQEWAVRRERGALASVRPSLERFVGEYPTLFIFRCILVSLYSEVGEEELARAELARLARDGFPELEVGTEWFFGASLLAEVCERLGERAHAPRLYEALLPYGDCLVVSHPEVNLGSAARFLGLLAATMGHADTAVAYLEQALGTNLRTHARPSAARTQADLARAVLLRGAAGDADKADELSRAARATFDDLGMSMP